MEHHLPRTPKLGVLTRILAVTVVALVAGRTLTLIVDTFSRPQNPAAIKYFWEWLFLSLSFKFVLFSIQNFFCLLLTAAAAYAVAAFAVRARDIRVLGLHIALGIAVFFVGGVLIHLSGGAVDRLDLVLLPFGGGTSAAWMIHAYLMRDRLPAAGWRARAPVLALAASGALAAVFVANFTWYVRNSAFWTEEWGFYLRQPTFPALCTMQGWIKFVPTPLVDNVALCRSAANAGSAPAEVALALGLGGAKDTFQQRLDWVNQAAAQNYTPAILTLASWLKPTPNRPENPELPTDGPQALALYQRAAALGNMTAVNLLNNGYRQGDVVQPDPVESLKWHELLYTWVRALPSERERFRASHEQIIAKYGYTPEQVAEAHARAQAFIADHPRP